MIAVERIERAATEADEQAAIEAIDRDGGVWLGCDVVVPQLYRREAKAALDPLLSVCLDGRRLTLVPHGDIGRALAARLAPLAGFEVHAGGRLEIGFDGATVEPHPASAWKAGNLPLNGAPKELTDLVMDDEFPLSMFYEAFEKKMRDVIASTSGISSMISCL